MKEVNLEEIIEEYDILDFYDLNSNYLKTEIKKAMKEACKQVLELASENAKIEVYTYGFSSRIPLYISSSVEIDQNEYGVVFSQSILNTINQVK